MNVSYLMHPVGGYSLHRVSVTVTTLDISKSPVHYLIPFTRLVPIMNDYYYERAGYSNNKAK